MLVSGRLHMEKHVAKQVLRGIGWFGPVNMFGEYLDYGSAGQATLHSLAYQGLYLRTIPSSCKH